MCASTRAAQAADRHPGSAAPGCRRIAAAWSRRSRPRCAPATAASACTRCDAQGQELKVLRYSSDLHCADCDLHYQDATQGLFSFNSPLGACDTCRGFGRVIGIDYGLVVPDTGKSLAGGAVRPWQTPSYKECQDDLLRFAKQARHPHRRAVARSDRRSSASG